MTVPHGDATKATADVVLALSLSRKHQTVFPTLIVTGDLPKTMYMPGHMGPGCNRLETQTYLRWLCPTATMAGLPCE